MGLTKFFFWCCLLVISGLVRSQRIDDGDTVVIEAAPKELDRQSKEVFFEDPVLQPYQHVLPHKMQSEDTLSSIPSIATPCFTKKGVIGQCTSFRQCYPYFKVSGTQQWHNWLYDNCEYFTAQERQMHGVCCTKDTISTELPKIANSNKSTSLDVGSNPHQSIFQFANWPPPLPTHPPHHTIPPLPTHPASSFSTKPPSWSPTTTKYPWPPAIPTKIPSWPPATNKPWPVTTTKPPYPTSAVSSTQALPLGHGCGSKNGYQDQERIVGGHNAEIGEWPWIAAIFNNGRQFCGGSLIDSVHILSAAHCVAHMSSWDVARLTVRLGDYNIRTSSEVRHIEKKVKRIVRHRGFDSRTLYNDIAILTLESPIQYTHQIRPICLPNTVNTFAGKTATVIGWGSLRESGPQPAVLQEVSIPVWSNQDCRLKYGAAAPGGIVDHMICAGQAAKDSCSGDSGGPLMVNAGRWIQAGIVSWGIGCGKGQYPGVYTRVDKFMTWISKNLN